MKEFCMKDKVSWTCECSCVTFDNFKCRACGKTPKYGEIDFEDFKEFIKILKKKEIIKKYGSIDIVKTGTIKIEEIDKLTGDLG